MIKRHRLSLHLLAVLATAAPAVAQAPRDARLIVTVVDQSGGVIPGATISVAGLEDATRAVAVAPAKTSEKGVGTVEGLVQGRYAVEAEFGGFEKGILKDVRLRRGDNKHVVVLALKNLQESVTVAQDAQAAAADPRGNAFKTALTREEISLLSDDPAEMAQQLQDLAGGNAIIRVDSFAGAPLPPKALIKSIHIVRDAFAAENHSAESEGIDIITQPGIGALRGGVSSRFRDGSMSARSPFTSTRGPERTQSYEGNIGGTLIKNKSSFSLSVSSRNAFDTPIANVVLPNGTQASQILDVRRPNDNWSMYGLVDYALTRDQTLRLSYDHSSTTRGNLGLGGFNYLTESGYSTDSTDHELRAQVIGPLGRRTFANTRIQMDWASTVSRSAVELRTIRVADTGTTGGAQIKGGRHPRDLEIASDVDYVRGMNTVRTGLLVDGGHYRSDDSTNYLGTYTFTTNADYLAGRPALYTQRFGDPLVQYWNMQAAAYVQDDIRVRKNLTLSPGLRYEVQTHLKDLGNLGPRFGVTWAPRKSGRTTLRGSWGIFYNWMNAGTYEQTLRVDGIRQQDLSIINPRYPNPGSGGTVLVTNRYLLGDNAQMARTIRLSAGIDQTLTPKVRVNATYSNTRIADLLRGQNLNAPVNGVRPDPAFANEIEVVADARSHAQQLATTLTVNFAGGIRNAGAPRWNWRRTTARVSYWLSDAKNNTDGAFSVPATGTLATEWGPAPGDRHHRLAASFSTQALKDLNASVTLAANTGTPYTITTGFDENGDAIFNDRPAGIGRNSIRIPTQATWSANLSYAVGVGTSRPSPSMQGGVPGARFLRAEGQERGGGERGGQQGTGRYRIVFTLSATNLTNRANYSGFSGVMTSPFFQVPTSVANPRKIDMGVSLRF